MTAQVIHPRLLAMNTQFFPQSCAIEAKTATQDDFGEEHEAWTPVTGLEAIGCAKAPLTAIERQAAGYTATDRVWNVLLQGAFPLVTTAHRAVVAGETFDIDATETDQTGTVTRLRVRQVTT